MSLAKAIFRQTAITSATTLTIQITTFAILLTASLLLTVEAFSKLSLIVAATMLANTFLDFGLNLTSTKFFGDSRDERYFLAAFRVRLLFLPLSVALAAILLVVTPSLQTVGIGILCGAFLNLWNGVRAADQAREKYSSFARSSIIFAALRAICGALALVITRDPITIALCLYLFPVIAIITSNSGQYLVRALRESGRGTKRMYGYAFYIYVNALGYVGLQYLPQFFVAERFDAVAIGTYGLLVTFAAPLSLLVYSLRAVLLPKILVHGSGIEEAMWSWRGFIAISSIALLLSLAGALVALLLDQLYGPQFPEFRQNFTIFFTGFAITSCIGLYSLSVHTLGLPKAAMWIALGKSAALVFLLALFGSTLAEVVVIASLIKVFGEIALATLLFHARRKHVI